MQPDLLPDLGLVLGDLGLGWDEGAAAAETDRSRVGPEGGNPAEETAVSRQLPPSAPSGGKS